MSNRKIEQRYLHLCNSGKQVFSCVPICERWTQHQVAQELYRRYQKKPAPQVLTKLLLDLLDAGMIRRDESGNLYREGISHDQQSKPKGENDMKIVTLATDPANEAAKAKEPKNPIPIAEIYAIAAELEALNERMGKAVLALDEYLDTQKADNDKARKIAELLKEINK